MTRKQSDPVDPSTGNAEVVGRKVGGMTDYCYIGRDEMGRLCAVVWDNPAYREDVADSVADMIRAGYVVSRAEGPVTFPDDPAAVQSLTTPPASTHGAQGGQDDGS